MIALSEAFLLERKLIGQGPMIENRLVSIDYNFCYKLIHSVTQPNGPVIFKDSGVEVLRDEYNEGLVHSLRHCVAGENFLAEVRDFASYQVLILLIEERMNDIRARGFRRVK